MLLRRIDVLARRLALAAIAVITLGLAFTAAPAMATDGTGTMAVSPTYVVSSSTGNDLTFTYTAGAGGMSSGNLTLLVPAGWTTPDANGFNAGGLSQGCSGNSPVISTVGSAHLITLTQITLNAGDTCQIRYGLSGFNAGVTAPSSAATNTFTTQESSTSGGTLTNLSAGSPQVVVGNDGTGTMAAAPSHIVVNTSGNTITFTYTAARTMSSGEITVAVPTGWSTPSTIASAAGATTSTCGTVGISGTTIQVTGVSLASSATCTITYGNTAGGPGATATSGGGFAPTTFTTQQEATNDNNLIALATSPTVSVTAADGTGTMTETPNALITSSTGNELDFTYTAPAGGLTNGQLSLLVPTGWTTPSSNGFNAGGSNVSCSGDPISVSAVGGGNLVTITGVSLNAGDTCLIRYGLSGFNSGVTAPSTQGTYTFTTKEASTSTGTLTSLSSSPQVTVGNDGTGTMAVSPTLATINTTGNTFIFTYTAARTISSGELTVAVPAGWSTPSASASAAGATTSTCGTVGISGTTIQVTGVSLASSATCTITYGNTAGGPGATAPSSGGVNTFTTQEESSNSGTLTTLGLGSPTVSVTAPDGGGAMSESPSSVITSSTGNELDFTYTAPTGGLNSGTLTLLVPTGWTTPDSSGFNAGGISQGCSGNTPAITTVGGGHLITLTQVTLSAGSTCQVKYGINGFNSGVTAPSSAGSYTFTTQEASSSTGTLTNLSGSPQVVVGADGLGAMAVAPTHAVVSSTGNTLTFTYTAGSAVSSGAVTVAIPAGWSTPSTTASAAGATTSTCGTVGVSGSTLQVTGINLANAASCTITYGSTAGGPGATAPSSGGTSTFTIQEKSSSGGTLTTLASAAPQVIVTALDGTGTMAESPSSVITGSTGNDLTFTYTAPTGGMNNGKLTLLVPTGWTTPDSSGFNAGGIGQGCSGNTPVITSVGGGSLVTISGVTLNAGDTCDIHYGLSGFNSGVTAPATPGIYTFTTQQAATSTGTLTTITAPTVTVGSDGSGTMAVSPGTLSSGATGKSLTFTYTSTTALSSGEVTVAIPAGWSAPSTTGTDPGFASVSGCGGGALGVSGSTIQVTGITIGSSTTCTITYGDTGSGGPGAVVSSTTGASTFATQQKSSSVGTLAALGTSPHLTVFAPDGSGTMSVLPTFAAAGPGANTLTFTYTAASGGLSNGHILVGVPAGWSTPTTTPGTAGFTTSTCGSVAIAGGTTIQVTGITLGGGGTCTVTFGSRSGGGTGADAPASPGGSTFTTQEESTALSTATSLASSPQVQLTSADGAGTLAAAPGSLDTGSSGNTLTFTYTAATGGLNGGEITIDVPAGFSAPSTAGSDPGYTTSGCGSVAVSSQTIQVTGVTLSSGATCSILYGDRGAGGPGATAPASDGTSTFTSREMSTGLGLLTLISSPPSVPNVTPSSLTVAIGGGAGSGTVTGGGISCPGTCSKSYSHGTSVSLTATPAAGFVFSGWSGACSGTDTCDLTMTSDRAVTATFTAVPGGGGNTSTPPSCTLTAGSKAQAPKKGKSGPTNLSLVAKCNQAANVRLTGTLIQFLSKRGKPATKSFKLGPVTSSLLANQAKTLLLKMPAAAVVALLHGNKESVAFVLTATNAHGTTHSTATIRALKH